MTRKALLFPLAAMLLAVAPAAAEPDEPGKGVARISLIHGDVSVRRGDSGDWVAAVINAPLLADDRVLTGAASRAEVQFDYYHRIRLAADTEIRLTQLEYRLYQIQVVRGTVTFSALKGGDAQVEINTPAAALRPVAWGEYRVTVYDDDRAELTVRRGEAEIFTPNGTQRLRPGRTMVARLDESNRSETRLVAEIPRDRWDEFNEARDRELSRAARVYQYVSRDIYGAEDLDGHGTWIYVAPYGWCWQPFVAVGWAPYRLGRWVWLDWYGWTWISYDPWGWAPYHYGRWFWWNNAWLWYPGPVIGVRHWWSPALVGWFGWSSWGGFTAGVGFGWGAVGWVPLAPFEPLYPWWGRRFAGYRSVNYVYQNTTIIQNTNITNIYRNARVRDGITVVRGDDFVRGQVGRPLRLGGEELARASVARGALPFAPARESLRWADREPAVRRADLDPGRNERFFSRMPVTRAERVPFDEQRRTLEQVATRGLGRSEADVRRPMAPAEAGSRIGAGFRGGEAPDVQENRGWRRADEPRRTETRTTENEWRRFGDPGLGIRTQEGARARTGETEGIRPRSEARPEESGRGTAGWRTFGDPARSPVRGVEGEAGERRSWSTGRGADSGRTGEAGEPARGTLRGESPRWSTGGEPAETPRMDIPRSETPRWSTGTGGGRERSESPGWSAPAAEPPRGESPRWSTGGGRNEDGGVRIWPAPRNEPTRIEPPRMEPPRMDRQAEPVRGGEERRGNPRSERGNQFAPMSRGGWSTGGVTAGGASGWNASAADSSVSVPVRGTENGAGVIDLSPRRSSGGGMEGGIRISPGGGMDSWRGSETRVSPRSERGIPFAPMTRGGWSTGGGAGQGGDVPAGGGVMGGGSSWRTGEGGVMDSSPRSSPRVGGGGWSTGGRTGWAADGFGGGAPSISVPRSAPSYGGFGGGMGGGMRSAPSFGGGSVSPGLGGGGMRSAPSFGGLSGGIGGGMRSAPGFGGGGVRGGSAPAGGGGMRGGRGR
ncbi:MAG: FecR domain-containing protein [Bryobacteraceae bacterium]|nr:FecR domain-containing protein [Bryobacteraceae bacterium]